MAIAAIHGRGAETMAEGVLRGVYFSPHFLRYAFSTYGERDLGFRKSEAKIILDHMKGRSQMT